MQHTIYLFDGFQLDVTRRKLASAGGIVLALNSRAMEALLLLVANAGQVVDKRRLLQTVWPNTIVEDNNLNQCVLAIRRALGESAGSNRFVMTVPGRGYCFVCPVHSKVQESAEEPQLLPTAAITGAPVAVTPPGAWRRVTAPRSFWLGLAIGAAVVTLTLLPFALHGN